MPLDILIIAAALTGVDYCEENQSEAYAINANGPRAVAEACARKGAKVIYIGTDFVFDGLKGEPYTEEDEVNPRSVYGASKAKGEEYVLEASPENLVVRVSWLYGAEKPAFPEWIIQQALKNESLSLPGEKMGSPTSCEDLASHLEALIDCDGGRGASGIVHLCNSGSCSWQEWGQFCVDTAVEAGLPVKARRIDANRLEDIEAFVAKRPVNSVLDTSKFTELTGLKPRDWREALREHLAGSPLLRDGGAADFAG
jgi:dTDP-4-dehydrorhamnose reductase